MLIDVSYKAFKVVFDNLAGIKVFYMKQDGPSYTAIVITAINGLSCKVLDPVDVKDFELTVIPTAFEVIDSGDVEGLVPLGLVPPTP